MVSFVTYSVKQIINEGVGSLCTKSHDRDLRAWIHGLEANRIKRDTLDPVQGQTTDVIFWAQFWLLDVENRGSDA